jgi:uncharacterized protein
MKFVNRRLERKVLDTFYKQKRAGLLVLYGRRRIGKTSLLSHWIDTLPHKRSSGEPDNVLFWTATTYGTAYQLRDFSQALLRVDPRFTSLPAPDFTFSDWAAAFEHLHNLATQHTAEKPFLAIIDEFTYLVQTDPAVVSVLQKVWDHTLSKSPNLRLVLSGSLVGIMEQEVLSAQSPLYGRATLLMKLRPLLFGTFREIFPAWSPAERVAAYAICGGVPAYIDLFTRSTQFNQGLRDYYLVPGSVALNDPTLLLNDRLHEPYVYESVLSAVANGFHTWSDIARMAGIPDGSLGHYLQTLQALEMVERRDPVFVEAGGRKGRYYVKDPFLRFYYRFIVPHRTAIERGDTNRALRVISLDLRAFIGTYVFEELCREWVSVQADSDKLGFLPEQIGSFWAQHRSGAVQLDIVAGSRREKQLFVGEAKWGNEPVPRNVLTDLIARSQRMPQVAEGWKTQYALFAREGFTEATQQAASELGARLVTLPELELALAKSANLPVVSSKQSNYSV